ncbi:hypothetical protein CCACVL1_20045 [Corchorus capsularis]|uniref:Uncharacterized protein n=1 Tax=Corchorus capsularis TaxID=210143 RepID=A0A1R3HCS9_COCAP|nr:hypothetical protein CCACVL1_20045 [Corchorus capsularis]
MEKETSKREKRRVVEGRREEFTHAENWPVEPRNAPFIGSRVGLVFSTLTWPAN